MQSELSLMRAKGSRETVMTHYADGPERLEKALRNLTEADLSRKPSGGGWSIREIVHHIADGDDLWKTCIKMALGNDNSEFRLDWYWTFSQTHWASRWTYKQRSVDTSLNLLRATRAHIVALLDERPDCWECKAKFPEPDGKTIYVSVGFIVEMQAEHVDHHIRRIKLIRQEYGV